MLEILDVGSAGGNEDMLKSYLGEDVEWTITRLDINPVVKPDILHDIAQPLPEQYRGKFDIVFCSHMMEHMTRKEVLPAMRHICSAVKNHGEVYIIVPSLEWCAQQIIEHKDGLAVQGLIFGGERQDNNWDVHKSGWTLNALRRMMEICGLMVKRAFQSSIQVSVDGGHFPAVQNVCIGARVDEINPPKAEGEELEPKPERQSILVTN
jgi:hypothetical protein